MSERHRKERKVSTKVRMCDAALLLLLAFAVRAVSLDAQGLWRDEVDQWRFALQPWGEMVRNFTRPGWNGPLFSPLLRLWIALTGESAYAMRYFSLLWGVVCVALIYALAKRLVDGRVAVWSALLLALSPYMVWYAQEVKMYTWVPMLALLALYALDRACEHERPRMVVVAGGAGGDESRVLQPHPRGAVDSGGSACGSCSIRRRHPTGLAWGLVVLALLTVPYLPLLAGRSSC